MNNEDGEILSYEEFRIGDSNLFAETAMELEVEAATKFEQIGERMFITRSTILGRMREKKLASYRAYRRYVES